MIDEIINNWQYLAIALIVIGVTAGNYFLNGGAKYNWHELTYYGFTFRYAPEQNLWVMGLGRRGLPSVRPDYPN